MKKKYKYFSKNKIKTAQSKRRFIVGDIHGCYNTFKSLVENKIRLTKKDQLFLLGDYIDKGPFSKKTVDYIIKLIEKGYKIYPLRGNHEDEKLKTAEKEPELLGWVFRRAKDMLENGKIIKKYSTFFKSLPYYYELDRFFLVHAGFNFKNKKPFADISSMLWLRRFEHNKKFIGKKTIIHGHQPVNIEVIQKSIKKKDKVIGLDCGVNYTKKHKIYDYKKMGRLCALNLDTYELFIQKNIEQ